ncbi:putative transcription termination factor MTERF8, chloroplastic-like [Cocos nucifera]|uniref:Putative transcription termination factor MTERF8, chloroplastic-like n=1 Tax=Cocos nucifera TaxID=13894 RepID=A0A8K0MYY8_COCNU|nr:putative transcription termination factor MTERF8, chloroplastic-like [Cocos nucifera]
MDRLGYSKDKALVASKSLLHITTPDKPDAVLAFLRGRAGLSLSQLRAFVRRRPTVLATNVRSNLLPKLKLLERLLPSPGPTKDLAYLATASASAFGYSAARIAPAVDLLRSLLPPSDPRAAIAALRRCSWLLTIDPDKVLSRNVDLLRRRGLDPSAVIEKAPTVLVLKPDILDAPFAFVEEDLGIASSSDCYLDAVNLAASLPKEDLLKKMEMLAIYGFSEKEKLTLIKRSPVFLRLKEEHMRRKLDFLVHTVGCTPAQLLRSSWLMMFNLESRLRPRYELLRRLQAKGLVAEGVHLLKALVMSEEEFCEEFVYKFHYGEGLDLVRPYMIISGKRRR